MRLEERKRRSQAAKQSPAMRQSKSGIRHGNPALTERILKAMPAEIDRIKAARLINDRAILCDTYGLTCYE